MTRPEFDAWIEEHYQELLAVAKRRVNSPEEAQDAVQHAIASALESRGYERREAVWPWMVLKLRDGAKLQVRGARRFRALRNAVKNETRAGLSLGRKRPAPRAD